MSRGPAAMHGERDSSAARVFESLEHAHQLRDRLLERGSARILIFYDLMQSLDGRECNAIGIHARDAFVVVSEPEARAEILGHRTHVANGAGLAFETPSMHGHVDE